LYASGQPGGARSDKLLYQAKLALDEGLRLKVVRKMFELRFGEKPPERRSVDQLRGIEGTRVKKMYELLARQYNVEWKGRRYDPRKWSSGDRVNRCLSSATSCLYGVTEAAILAAGYAPSVGFLHTGKPLSFVYDIADIFKFDTVVPVAFQVAATKSGDPERAVRIACRDAFRQKRLLKRIIPLIEEVLAAGEITPPPPPKDAQPPAIPEPATIGDDGHRSK
jgi:CRISPR-associated protein Cas1